MKFLRHTDFLEPYVKAAESLIPLHKITRIRAFKVKLSNEIQTDGICNRFGNGTYEIALSLWEHNEAGTRHMRLPLLYVLDSLAHELAHMQNWARKPDHTPEHGILTAKLLIKFLRVAKKLGIRDMYKPWKPKEIS